MNRYTISLIISLIFLAGSLNQSMAKSKSATDFTIVSEKDSVSVGYYATLLTGRSSEESLNKTYIGSMDLPTNKDLSLEDNMPLNLSQIKVAPSAGSYQGGCNSEDYYVEISGAAFGNGWDINKVTICGVEVCHIIMQSSNTVVVYPNSGTPGKGDIVIYSESKGKTTIENAFTYYVPQSKEQAKKQVTKQAKNIHN